MNFEFDWGTRYLRRLAAGMFIDKMGCTLDVLCSWKLANVRATFVSGLYEDICHVLLRMSSRSFHIRCLSKKSLKVFDGLLGTIGSNTTFSLPPSLQSTVSFDDIADIKEDKAGFFVPTSDYFPAIDSIVRIDSGRGIVSLSCNATTTSDHPLTGSKQMETLQKLAAHFKQPVVLLWLVPPAIFKSFPEQKLGSAYGVDVVQYAVEMSIGKAGAALLGDEKKRIASSSTEEMEKNEGSRGPSKRGRKKR